MVMLLLNAFYSPASNVFVILNGLVRGLVSDNVAELYGLLGTVIGHEITHAFDSSGSLFDEHGNYNEDWLPEDDKIAFDSRVNKLITFLNKITLYDNVKIDGDNVDGEATADMGGIKVMLKLAKEIEDFDYDAFFKSYAYLWRSYPRSKSSIAQAVTDVHPLGYIRTNVTLAQFDEFVETYNLGPGDGMYIPKSQRINVW